jgi:thymidylate synthase (FAD)
MDIEYIQHSGSDLTVVNAARVSFDKRSDQLIEKDERLIKYLAKNNHWTPFAHCHATYCFNIPLCIAAQLKRHTVGFAINEVSRRYVDSPPKFYMPGEFRERAENVKQGSGDTITDDQFFKDAFNTVYGVVRYVYKALLDQGLCPEQARMILPTGTATSFWMTGSLYAWARLCNQRLDSHAQKEIQYVAHLLSDSLSELYPVSWQALIGDDLK